MALPTVQDIERCVCGRCPSYVEGDTKLFCLHGKSAQPVVERGCFCRTCPVHIAYSLSNRAFCLRGKAKG